ncbi:GTPase [Ruminococcus flavefaciens]|uniref:GTPase n=1 Tax=Ruminococcus flavefaciens TaxID=1265 RepID=UPI00048DB1A9|nr:GTPase domain-containing protein [Ruminococcus flavefaciens]
MSTNENQITQTNDVFDTANIIIAGITGAGKSTLINAVFGKDFAATGKGKPVTQEIKEYRNPNVPVRIWDSIGFEIGNDNSGVSKTKASITKIKKTIEEQASKDQVDHIHAIWYCINQGGSRYQPTEAEFVRELHSIGVPFIIVITQCIEEDDEFVNEINNLNFKNGITDIPVIEVLAQDKTFRGGGLIPSFGLDLLVDETMKMLPDFVKGSFIAGQQIKVVLKREECESIITKYEKMAETGFWDKVPFINMGVVDNRFKKMVKDIFAVYNQILSEKAYDDIIFDLSKSWTKGLFSWCIVPAAFNKNKDKLERLMSEIEKKGADGLELETREFKESTRAARMITYYGYTLLMAIEDVWKLIREEKIKNIEEVVIPQIKQRIQYYLSGRRRNNH